MPASRLHALTHILDVNAYFLDVPKRPGAMKDMPDLLAALREPNCLRLNEAFIRISDPSLRRAIIHFIEALSRTKSGQAGNEARLAGVVPEHHR